MECLKVDKKQKQLEKALKLAGIDKEKFDQVIGLFEDDEEQDEKEEKAEKSEQPKVEATKEQPKEEKTFDIDEVLKKLGLNDIKSVIENQAKEISELKETVKKAVPAGAKPKPNEVSQGDESEYSFENLLGKLGRKPEYK